MPWLVITTWKFSLPGVRAAAGILRDGGDPMDAAVEVVRSVESDPRVDSVGLGGFPNRDGEVELDAAVMDGRTLEVGAVASVKGFLHPVEVARRVLTDSPYSFLVGSGAEDFAEKCGMERGDLVTEEQREKWVRWKELGREDYELSGGGDTVCAIAIDSGGHLACATSSSGLRMKHPGRVGDSPLVGSGFYVDDEIGGAVATGLGEDIMKGCICFRAVELMGRGSPPDDAAREVVRRLHDRLADAQDRVRKIAVICLDNRGNYGAAANHGAFDFAVATSADEVTVLTSKNVLP
jgi:isoaspartyl peptidase/L-asparaginase-like protein (Ntn-hydrolase superfamily)